MSLLACSGRGEFVTIRVKIGFFNSFKKMNLLAIDSSSENISLAVMHRGDVLFAFNRRLPFGSSKIISYLEKYFKKFSLSLGEFDAFILGSGPGSFTGLRISFSIIKGFSLALSRPAITIGSFFSIAYPFIKQQHKIAVISDARRNFIYASSFLAVNGVLKIEAREHLTSIDDFIKEKRDYFFITPDENLRRSALSLYPKVNFHPENIYPDAECLLELAKSRYLDKDFTAVDKLEPLYLHPKTCQIRPRLTAA